MSTELTLTIKLLLEEYQGAGIHLFHLRHNHKLKMLFNTVDDSEQKQPSWQSQDNSEPVV